jgi:hypothetical protein
VTTEQAIQLADLKRLVEVEAPDLSSVIQAFLRLPPPAQTAPLPPEVMTLDALRAALRGSSQTQKHEAWQRLLNQPGEHVPDQLRLAELVTNLYERQTPAARATLLTIAAEAPLLFGVWGGLKRVYKRAEKDLDAEVFATLAVRFDHALDDHAGTGDVSRGTLGYLSKRAARFLRLLGKASPELYVDFAVEVLRRSEDPYEGNVAQSLMQGGAKKWGAPKGLAKKFRFRAPYLEAWKLSAEPLKLLLETARSEAAAEFGALGLRELHPEALRNLRVDWLAKLAYRPLASVHEFLVELLVGSAELHQGNLEKLGLKQPVLALLSSPSAKARKYAIEYARGHAGDLPVEQLLELLNTAYAFADTRDFVVGLLTARRPARALGLETLARLLGIEATHKFAAATLDAEFDRSELSEAFLRELLFDHRRGPADWARRTLDARFGPTELPLSFWTGLLDDERLDRAHHVLTLACTKIEKYPVEQASGDWLLAAMNRRADLAARLGAWLAKADKLPPSLDLERLRGLVFDPRQRAVAFTILGNPKIVEPREVGLPWLLALARRADPSLHEWAHRYLLTQVKPDLFAEGKPNVSAGVARLFELARGAKEPEPVRAFAQLYLRCHHPKLGKREPETKALGIKPAIPLAAYSEERVWPCLFDLRPDVRRFGLAIARLELRRWGATKRVYELAEASAKEVRNLAYEALFQAGEPDADPDFALTVEELDAAQIFALTESRKRSSRDAGMDLIRKHYVRIGGIEKLGWLMQSADREVRLFAVRLLWQRHRPRGLPAEWKPRSGTKLRQGETFSDAEAMRAFLRRLLFSIPATRSAESLEQARAKKLSTSVAKRQVIEIVRDLGLADVEFAKVVAPVLEEFTGSIAKGEWQTCLSALMRLRAAHGPELVGGIE